MAPRVKLFIPLLLFVGLALFLFRGLQLDPTELPSALIDRPLPVFELPALGMERLLTREDVTGEVALFNVWATSVSYTHLTLPTSAVAWGCGGGGGD